MKKMILFVLSLCLCFTAFGGSAFAETAPAKKPARTTRIQAHFATVEEGQQAMRNRTLYHEQVNAANLEFLLQKKGGTLEEYIEYAAEQVLPFTEEDEKAINDALDWLQQQLESHGLTLPDPGPITYVKTTMKEDEGAGGYTSEGCIFLYEHVFAFGPDCIREYVVHETFHCLSRLFPEFREKMYALIGFRLLDEDIDIPQNLKDQFVANPDVEHHNSVATFTINGEKKDCYLLFMTDDVFEKPGDKFFDHKYTYIVPLGESTGYRVDDVPDFWDVVGRNTDYAEDPEEIMASNFWFAIQHLEDGYQSFKSPEILEGIVDILKAETPAADMTAEEIYQAGRDAYFAKDYGKALEYYQLAAEQGDSHAMFALGEYFFEGKAQEKDLDKAEEWYRKALDAGFVPRDDEEAAHLKELVPGWVDNRSAESAPQQ